jgi:hypothetical protein
MAASHVKKEMLTLVMILSPALAHATIPPLPQEPKIKSRTTCRLWSQRAIRPIEPSSKDVILMWGLEQSGVSSRSLAARRLTEFCLGKTPPLITGFYSGVSAAESYCKLHARTKLCKSWRKDRLKEPPAL